MSSRDQLSSLFRSWPRWLLLAIHAGCLPAYVLCAAITGGIDGLYCWRIGWRELINIDRVES